MEWQFTPLLVPIVVATIAALIYVEMSWRRRRSTIAAHFGWLCLGIAVWSGAYAVELAANLRDLLELKNYKDSFGKDEVYLAAQPKAWEKARATLERYEHAIRAKYE